MLVHPASVIHSYYNQRPYIESVYTVFATINSWSLSITVNDVIHASPCDYCCFLSCEGDNVIAVT